MENIKFRAWDKKENKMFYDVQKEHDANITSYDSFDQVLQYMDVMQYTGFNDSNGIEIYEGDLVKRDDSSKGKYWRVAKVVFDPGHFTFRIISELCINCFQDKRRDQKDFKLGSFMYCPDPNAYGNVLEVIGNIYDQEAKQA